VLEYNGVTLFTFVEEDGELRFLNCKDFCDPQERAIVHAEVAKIQSKGAKLAM